MVAALAELDVVLAFGAATPFLLLGKTLKKHILSASFVRGQLLILAACEMGVPGHHAAHAEKPVARRALHTRINTFATDVLDEQGRAIWKRAIYTLPLRYMVFYKQDLPRIAEFPWEKGLASFWG